MHPGDEVKFMIPRGAYDSRYVSCLLAVVRVFSELLRCSYGCVVTTHHAYGLVTEPRHDKTNKMSVRPAKTQISCASAQSDQSSLCAQWVHVAKDANFLYADSEDSDQTGRMPRLIWVFAGREAILLVFSCRGSTVFNGSIVPTFTRERGSWSLCWPATCRFTICGFIPLCAGGGLWCLTVALPG